LTQEVFLTQEHLDNNFSSRMFFDSRILYFIKKTIFNDVTNFNSIYK
jgi:hypothetical protein